VVGASDGWTWRGSLSLGRVDKPMCGMTRLDVQGVSHNQLGPRDLTFTFGLKEQFELTNTRIPSRLATGTRTVPCFNSGLNYLPCGSFSFFAMNLNALPVLVTEATVVTVSLDPISFIRLITIEVITQTST